MWDNTDYIKQNDEVKFVIGNREDYDWAKDRIAEYNLAKKCSILMSPTYTEIKSKKIVEWILEDNLDIRFQIQLHKEIWDSDKKGV